jgi:UDP-N-acetylmuramoyl-tripeptide--D-alanyl-D-alanine ligase
MDAGSVARSTRWTSGQLARIVNGQLVDAAEDLSLCGVSTDSRGVVAGDVFFALAGENHDGRAFAAQAVAAGAALVVVSDRLPGLPCLIVADTLAAYAALAAEHVLRLRDDHGLRVIGITGSSGKTSTKDLVAAVLSTQMNVVAPVGSFNNDVGLPATVLQADEVTDVLVLEMGMRGLGHIQRLCSIAAPDVSVVLNVGSAHVGEVGSVSDIAEAKSEIIQFATRDAIAILNLDDSLVSKMAHLAPSRVIGFGRGENADIRAEAVCLDAQARARFMLCMRDCAPQPVELAVAGEHQVMNALAASAVARAAGMSAESIAAALSSATIRSRWRMEVVSTADGITVVNDAYNANPESMTAALHALTSMGDSGSAHLAVLGDMLELGEFTEQAHLRIGALARQLGVAHLVAVGSFREHLVRGYLDDSDVAVSAGGNVRVQADMADDWLTAVNLIIEHANPGDVVLVKASRGIGLERVAEQLIGEFGRVSP